MKRRNPDSCHDEQGFTLLEMTIVLVVIGLIIAGIMEGKGMARAAQLRAMVGEYGQYLKATKEFQEKYLALPGDFNGAEALWGTDPNGCPAASNTVAKVATCNGDGNGMIGSSSADGSSQTQQTEWFRAWQHMADAGFIAWTFTGVAGPDSATEGVPRVNIPKSQVKGAGWTLYYYLQNATTASLWGDQYGHLFFVGGYVTGQSAFYPVLTPAEAMEMDQKLDDGNPGRGVMRAWRSGAEALCTTDTGTQDSQVYNTADTELDCSPIFITGF